MKTVVKEIRIEKYIGFAEATLKEEDPLSAAAIARALLHENLRGVEGRQLFLEAQRMMYEKRGFLGRLLRWGPYVWSYLNYSISSGEKRLQWVDKMLEARPASVQGLRLLSKVSEELGLAEMAVAAKERLVRELPDCEETGLGLAENYLKTRRFQDAIELGEAILLKNPGSARALHLVHQAAVDIAMNGGVGLDSENGAKALT